MSKYIDADLYVEMQIYDDEYEEWSLWNGTIEDLLNQWTEQGCPPAIEVNEDCISRANLIESFLADNECKREEAKACMCSLDSMLELIEDSPSVTPTEPKPILTEEVREAIMRLTMCAREECSICKYEHNCGFDKQVEIATESMNTILKAFREPPTERTGEWIASYFNECCGTNENHELVYRKVPCVKCDQCGEKRRNEEKFCPNCGAKMKG